MREEEEEPNWFARWEEQLPSPEELMPLSQTLITPDLALAFDIPTAHHPAVPSNHLHNHHHSTPAAAASDFETSDLNSAAAGSVGGGGVGGADEPARTLKRPRLVWTPQLHKRFVDAVAHLGIKNAVPKTIMQLMSVDGLTRENVASHLQKYRLYLKRMQGLSASGGGAGAGGPISAADAATDQLFASAPVPHHFLSRGPAAGPGGPPEPPFLPFVPVAAMQHHQQITAAMQQQQQQYYHRRHMGQFGSPTSGGGGGGGGGLEHGFLGRSMGQTGIPRMMGPAAGIGTVQQPPPSVATSFVDELESGVRGGGGGGRRTELTLFPTGDD